MDALYLLSSAWRDGYDRHCIAAHFPEDAVALNGLLTSGSMGAMWSMDMRTGLGQ